MSKRFKVGLYGLLLVFTAVLSVGQASFAGAGNKIQKVYESEDGSYGISRIKIPSSAMAKAKTRAEILATVGTPAAVELYCAFTAETTPTDFSDENDTTPVTYYAWNNKNWNYLVGSFAILNKESKVTVHWDLDGTEISSVNFEDALNTPSKKLLKSYWYFAWYKTKKADFTVNPASGSLHDFKVRVSVWDGSSEVAGTEKEDSCKFRAY